MQDTLQADEWITTKELMQLFRCSRSTIYRRVASGDLPAPRKFGASAVRHNKKAALDRMAALPAVHYAPQAA